MRYKLGDLTKISTGKLDANAADENGKYPFFTCSQNPLKISSYSYDCECVLVAGNGDLNVKYYKGKFDAYQRTYIIENSSNGKLYMPYLYYFMSMYVTELRKQAIGGVIKYIKLGNLTNAIIDLPTVENQKDIVDFLEKVESVLNQRRTELSCLDALIKSRFVEMFGDLINSPKYPGIKFGSIGKMVTGGTPSRKHDEYYGGSIPFVSTPCLGKNFISEKDAQNYLTEEGVKNSATHIIPPYSLMIGSRVGVGKSSINTCEMCTNQDVLSFVQIDKAKYDLLFLKKVIDQYAPYYDEQKRGATIKGITSDVIKNSMIPDVPIELQKEYTAIVNQADKSKLAIQKSLDETQLLFDSLMQEYFG